MFVHVHPDFLYPGWNVAAFSKSTPNLVEIKEWCYNTYGHPGFESGWIEMCVYGEIIFQRESDLNLFLLKWA